jgi:hypothetical protein
MSGLELVSAGSSPPRSATRSADLDLDLDLPQQSEQAHLPSTLRRLFRVVRRPHTASSPALRRMCAALH